jgi:cytoskeleton protein RodZ
MTELGELLEQARAFKGVSLREVERATRINRDYIAALEAEDFAQLPPSAYARGIVRNYAAYLGLDTKTVLDLFDQRAGGPPRKSEYEVTAATKPLRVHSHWAPNFAIIAFMVFISAIVFAWMYSAYFKSPETLATRTVGVATVTPVATSLIGIAPTPPPTVSTQGGGVATTTPTVASPTAAPDASTAAPDEANQPDEQPTEDTTVDVAPTEADTSAASDGSICSTPSGHGSHTFVLSTSSDVWVDATVDGVSVLSQVLSPGCEPIFYGDSVEVSSGNSAFVHVYIDGDDMGTLGDTWDATFAWP